MSQSLYKLSKYLSKWYIILTKTVTYWDWCCLSNCLSYMAQLLCIQRCCLSLCSKLTEILLSNWLSFIYVLNCVKCGNRFGAKTMNGIFCGKGDMIICSLLWLRAPKFFVKLSEKETDSVPKRARSFLHKR